MAGYLPKYPDAWVLCPVGKNVKGERRLYLARRVVEEWGQDFKWISIHLGTGEDEGRYRIAPIYRKEDRGDSSFYVENNSNASTKRMRTKTLFTSFAKGKHRFITREINSEYAIFESRSARTSNGMSRTADKLAATEAKDFWY